MCCDVLYTQMGKDLGYAIEISVLKMLSTSLIFQPIL